MGLRAVAVHGALTGLLAGGVLALPGTALAATTGPAQVTAPARAVLAPGGRVRVVPTVRCARGYRVYELYVQVAQPSGARAQAYRVPGVACDGRQHRVPVVLPTVHGQLRPGAGTVEAMLFVTSTGSPPALSRDRAAATVVAAPSS